MATTSVWLSMDGRLECRCAVPLGERLWEVRSSLPSRRIARVLFCLVKGELILLHGFVKKTQKTPPADLALAHKRQKEVER